MRRRRQAFCLPTTALALRVLAPPKFVLVAKLLRANGRSGGFCPSVFDTSPCHAQRAARAWLWGKVDRASRAARVRADGGSITTLRSAATKPPCAARRSALAVGISNRSAFWALDSQD